MEELDAFIVALDRLHQQSERADLPDDNAELLRNLRVPNPLIMPSAWRGGTRKFRRPSADDYVGV